MTRHSGCRPECIQLWPNFDRTLFSVGHIRACKSSCLYQTGILDNEKQNDFANPVTTESRTYGKPNNAVRAVAMMGVLGIGSWSLNTVPVDNADDFWNSKTIPNVTWREVFSI